MARKYADIIYEKVRVESKALKYTPDQTELHWGPRHLIHHLLWHGAVVNKNVRNIVSRGPAAITVNNFVLSPDPDPESE